MSSAAEPPVVEELAAWEHTATRLARAAGDQALAAFRQTLALEFKGKRQDSPVTALDRDVETFLRRELRTAFPDHGLLGEEQADDIAPGARYIWVLDPIDGTTNFAAGFPLFGISVGLLRDGVPIVGCIWVPIGPTLGPGAYHARTGGGTWFDDTPIRVTSAADERGQIMSVPGDFGRTFRVRRPAPGVPRPQRALPDGRTTGSCTAECVLIASGTLRAGIMVKPSIWDVAAGTLLIQEAGGRVLTWRNDQWQDFVQFDPDKPRRSREPPGLRHWGRPLLMGAPDALDRLLPRLAWRPRLPRAIAALLRT